MGATLQVNVIKHPLYKRIFLLYQHCFIDEFDKKCFEFSASGVTESSTILESDRKYGDGIARNGQLFMIGGNGDAEMTMEHVAPGETVQSGPAI